MVGQKYGVVVPAVGQDTLCQLHGAGAGVGRHLHMPQIQPFLRQQHFVKAQVGRSKGGGEGGMGVDSGQSAGIGFVQTQVHLQLRGGLSGAFQKIAFQICLD